MESCRRWEAGSGTFFYLIVTQTILGVCSIGYREVGRKDDSSFFFLLLFVLVNGRIDEIALAVCERTLVGDCSPNNITFPPDSQAY